VELIAILFMLIGGGAIAIFVLIAIAIARRSLPEQPGPSHRESVAASILFHVLNAGGATREEAMREIRRVSGIAAPVTAGIDVCSWAESYARNSSPQQRSLLLEHAVQIVAASGKAVPLRQYAALLDLSFGLGFQTDALARLRKTYGFDYIDHARASRPGGGLAPAYSRPLPRSELLAVLGVSGEPTRQQLSAAYRKLVTRHHPDRFHTAPEEARNEAARRFIEITRAYEELLTDTRD
jgi:hypothetical protein